ncbi:hypothetical protein LMANV2_220031 [Leptospira interrogans serovar Manilae]|uniref:Uncharacterized protein n=1 Tax=Leptospira interrogans serovar Manilae TaxID=214675 RepID=A0AAQ1SMZ2_LEPIR|nr:hypothetical protein LMANV2_220031 [Leptospira interrogans serovar Manilae]
MGTHITFNIVQKFINGSERLTTRTHENSTKLLTAEFTKKIAVLKKYRKFEIMAF